MMETYQILQEPQITWSDIKPPG